MVGSQTDRSKGASEARDHKDSSEIGHKKIQEQFWKAQEVTGRHCQTGRSDAMYNAQNDTAEERHKQYPSTEDIQTKSDGEGTIGGDSIDTQKSGEIVQGGAEEGGIGGGYLSDCSRKKYIDKYLDGENCVNDSANSDRTNSGG